jgi:cytochrome c peroxidase
MQPKTKQKLLVDFFKRLVFWGFILLFPLAYLTWRHGTFDEAVVRLSGDASVERFPEITSWSEVSGIALASTLSAEHFNGINKSISSPKVSFGKKLFFDTRMSRNGNVSCATCHTPERAFTDGKALAFGLSEGTKNTPTVVNTHAMTWFFHNGRAPTLTTQALGPIENSLEHGFSREGVFDLVMNHYKDEYTSIYGRVSSTDSKSTVPHAIEPNNPASKSISPKVLAFILASIGDKVFLSDVLSAAQSQKRQPIAILEDHFRLDFSSQKSDHSPTAEVFANVGDAIATFEKQIRSNKSPFDMFIEQTTTSPESPPEFIAGFGTPEFEGMKIFFGKGGCHFCHAGPYFTDQQFHNIGLSQPPGQTLDLGRITGLLVAQNQEFGCNSKLIQETDAQGCTELKFANTENFDFVGAFKTPGLRHVAETAPYGHDGRFQTLREIINHYNNPGDVTPAVGHRSPLVRKLHLRETEIQNLESFLQSLSSDYHIP